MLNEIIPCGIDPVGVFILETREERERRGEGEGEKDLREVHRLLGALPVSHGRPEFPNLLAVAWQIFLWLNLLFLLIYYSRSLLQ